VANSTHGGHGPRDALAPAPSTYSDSVATHLLLFTEAGQPLEAYHWLLAIKSKFGLLCCTEVQKTLESASRPLVDFRVLNDNLIKCLISCAK
jgi:hypothetical protein